MQSLWINLAVNSAKVKRPMMFVQSEFQFSIGCRVLQITVVVSPLCFLFKFSIVLVRMEHGVLHKLHRGAPRGKLDSRQILSFNTRWMSSLHPQLKGIAQIMQFVQVCHIDNVHSRK